MVPKCNDQTDSSNRRRRPVWLKPIPPHMVVQQEDGTELAIIEYIYITIVRRIEWAIRRGWLKSGQQLPTQRDMATAFEVSVASVARAIKLMKGLEEIKSEPGKRTIVADDALELITAVTPEPKGDDGPAQDDSRSDGDDGRSSDGETSPLGGADGDG